MSSQSDPPSAMLASPSPSRSTAGTPSPVSPVSTSQVGAGHVQSRSSRIRHSGVSTCVHIGIGIGIGVGVGISVCICIGVGVGIGIGVCIGVSVGIGVGVGVGIGVCIGVRLDPVSSLTPPTSSDPAHFTTSDRKRDQHIFVIALIETLQTRTTRYQIQHA